MVSHQYYFKCTLQVLLEVCGIWASGPNFEAVLDPKTSQNCGLWSFSQKVFNGLTSVLLHMLIARTFRCVEDIGLRGPLLGHFGSQYKSKFRSLVIFSNIFLWFRIGLGLHVSFGDFYRCVEYRPQRPNFRLILGPKIDHNSGLQSYSQIFPLLSHHSFTCLLGVLLGVFQWCAPKALFQGLELRLQHICGAMGRWWKQPCSLRQ